MDFAPPYFRHLILLSLLLVSTSAQTNPNRTLGSSLKAGNDSTSWTSPSGEFVFGFQQIKSGMFLLAIWFNKIPKKTIIWSANHENLVHEGSRIELTMDGQFVLSDPQGNKIWKAKMSATGIVAYAAMLDTGNFVLASHGGSNLWESFVHPTDTILPTQILNKGTTLVARDAQMNYSTGRYQFWMQTDGNLVLYTTELPNNSPAAAYWSSDTMDSGFQVIFNQSGTIYLTAENGSILNFITSNVVSAGDFYQRAVLEYDGIFRQYVYPKTKYPGVWSLLSSVPSNICLRINPDTGIGACGYNSFCVLTNDETINCECPPGYSFLDSNNMIKGCKKDFVPQVCGRLQDADSFSLIEMPNSDFVKTDYEVHHQVSEDWCRMDCLTDCFCDAVLFQDGICSKKNIPLRNGRQDSSVNGNLLIKVRKGNSTETPVKKDSRKSDHSALILTASLVLSNSVSLTLLLVVALFVISHFNSTRKKKFQLDLESQGMILRSFTYKELVAATSKFKEELGKGASSTVYKGVLSVGSGKFVAVKKLDRRMTEGKQEFQAEIRAIAMTNHRNLAQLQGFCMEKEHRILVYEYMSNGSLADYLFGTSRPNWYERIQVALGTARGLAYLHEECSIQIIHCDIKPNNILLDDSLMARISDFGLAKLLKTDQTRTMTAIRGTRGYVAPEWFKNMPITVKVDVYSFGMVLLELICCRKSFQEDAGEEKTIILADWTRHCYEQKSFELLVQNDEDAIKDIKRVERFVLAALWCIQEEPSVRPTMRKVLQMLEGVVDVPLPPLQKQQSSVSFKSLE